MDEIFIENDTLRLPGQLTCAENQRGLVLFAYGSGSSRLSPRNQQVAASLHRRAMGTLLFDLLTPDETRDRKNVFDIPLLAGRLMAATAWVRRQPALAGEAIGYFGASTGAAAALVAAAELGDDISAVVSRGGRPDLALTHLAEVMAPTLLIVGGHDYAVIEMNRRAALHLARCELVVVPDATHLFDEPGALEQVCDHAGQWFARHLHRALAT